MALGVPDLFSLYKKSLGLRVLTGLRTRTSLLCDVITMPQTPLLERYEAQCKSQQVQENESLKVVLRHHSLDTSSEVCLRGNLPGLRKSRLTDTDLKPLLTGLLGCPASHLNFSYNRITDEGTKHIAAFLKQSLTVEHLDVSFNDIEESGVQAIAAALQLNSTLKSVNLAGNKFANKGGMYMAIMLQVNTTLEHINLADTDLGAESVIALATVLNQNNTVTYLNINRPLIQSRQEETTIHIAKMLKVNTGLQELHLQKHDIRHFGAEWLYDNLKHNMTLKHLDLSCNRIGRDGAGHVARLLTLDTQLTHLDLSYNRIEDEGVIAISNALTHYNRNLKMLAICGNKVSGHGLCALAKAIKANSSLTHVYIWGNKMDEETCKAFSSLTSGSDPRINPANTDVQPYVVDGVTYLANVT